VLAAMLLAAAGSVFAYAWAQQPDGGGSEGPHPLRIEGPGGGPVWEGEARAPGGTALAHLQEAARLAGFTVEVEDMGAAFGPDRCAGLYVRAIAGIEETRHGGWNYYVQRKGSPHYAWIPHAAACHPLQGGDRVLWRWVDAGA